MFTNLKNKFLIHLNINSESCDEKKFLLANNFNLFHITSKEKGNRLAIWNSLKIFKSTKEFFSSNFLLYFSEIQKSLKLNVIYINKTSKITTIKGENIRYNHYTSRIVHEMIY